MKVVIVGGVAGGASAAARLRRLDEQAEIIVFERTGFVSYANCGLPYYIGGVIEEESALTLQSPKGFWDRFHITVKTSHEVSAIHPEEHTVEVHNLETGEHFIETYDKLILSPGAHPIRPELPGIDSKRLFCLRTVEDTLRIHSYVQEHKPASAVVVGGGYIGIEAAENLRELGLEVTLLQRPKQLMNNLDFDMATFVHMKMRDSGINLHLGANVTGFQEVDGRIVTNVAEGSPITADMVLLAIGVMPESHLAKEAGLRLGMKGAIAVNDRMETSAPDVYAVGDAVQVKHQVTGEYAVISLAGPANKQGRIVADVIAGLNGRYKGSLGSSAIKVFDLTVANTGLSEKAASAAGYQYESVVLSPGSHAGYYPGATPMTMKVVFEQETLRLLGAQIVGGEGVDKRIDVLATAIQAGIRADQLKDLDLAYAPPYSSAKDPVNMAGFMIENLATGIVKQWHWDQEPSLPRDGSVQLLDVRTVGEYERGHIEGFTNIPVDSLRDNLGELDPSKPVYVICQSGVRSYIASRILTQRGFDCFNFSGGYRFFAAVTKERRASNNVMPCGMEQ